MMFIPSSYTAITAAPQFSAKDRGKKKAEKELKRKKKLADRKAQKDATARAITSRQVLPTAGTPAPVTPNTKQTTTPVTTTPTPTSPPVLVSATPKLVVAEATLPILPEITRREHPIARQIGIEPLSGLTVLIPGQQGRFNAGTMQESQLFRNPQQIYALGQYLLKQYPLGKSQPVQLRVHGMADGREITSLLLAMADQHIRANRPDIKPITEANYQEMTTKEAEVMRQLGRQFRITGVEKNPSLVQRAQDGIYELEQKDFLNLQALQEAHPSSTIEDRLTANGAILYPYGDNSRPFLMASSPTLWAKGDLKQGDIFRDAADMPEGQAGVMSRNVLSYLVHDRIGLSDYFRRLRDKMLPKAPLLLGEVDATNRMSLIAEPIREALDKYGFQPIPDDVIPHNVPPEETANSRVGFVKGPLAYANTATKTTLTA